MPSRGSRFSKKPIHTTGNNGLLTTGSTFDHGWQEDLMGANLAFPDSNSPVQDDMSMVFCPTGLAPSVDHDFLSVGLRSGSPGLLSPPRTPPTAGLVALNQHLGLEPFTLHNNYSVPGSSWAGIPTSQGLIQPSLNHAGFSGNLDGGTAIIFDHSYGLPAAAAGGWVHHAPTPYSSPAAAAPAPAWGLPMEPASPVLSTLAAAAKPLRKFRCDMFDIKGFQSPEQSKRCQASFKQRKDLIRHKRTVHATGDDPYYRCRCATEGVRKDNYLRHVRDCNKPLRLPFYLCKCQYRCADKKEHADHVTDCQFGFGRHGRPSAI